MNMPKPTLVILWSREQWHEICFLSRMCNWDLEFNGFWGWKCKRAQSPWDFSIEYVVWVWCTLLYFSHCLLLVKVFAIPGESCYQILKMLSSPRRLPTRAGDMSPSSLYRLSLSSLNTGSFQMSKSYLDVLFSFLALLSHVYIAYIINCIFDCLPPVIDVLHTMLTCQMHIHTYKKQYLVTLI